MNWLSALGLRATEWLRACGLDDAGAWSWHVFFMGSCNIAGYLGLLTVLFGFFGWVVYAGRRAGKFLEVLTPINATWPLHNNLPQRDRDSFVERPELGELIRHLARGGSLVVQARVAGMGGIGKTALAFEAAYRLKDAKQFEGVWYVPAGDRDSIQRSLGALARELNPNLVEADATPERALNLVSARRQPWLLLYDNATMTSVRGFLPEEGAVRVLLTSRETHWPGHFAAIDLAKMRAEEARTLLRHRLPDPEAYPDADLDRLAIRLDFWPLGLVAAAGYLHAHPNTGIPRYIAAFDARKEEIGRLDWSLHDYDGADSLATALTLSFDDLGPDERDLLSVLCFLNADDLWPEMIEKGCAAQSRRPFGGARLPGFFMQAGEDPQPIRDAFDGLARRSLVERDGFEARMHRLTAEFWRIHLADDAARWADAAAQLVNAVTPWGFDNPEKWEVYRRLLPQARALLPHARASLAAARQFNQVGGYALVRGVTVDDLDFAQGAVSINEKLQPNSHDHAVALNNLAEIEKALGREKHALTTLERVRRIKEALPDIGPRHPSYAFTLNSIAGLHLGLKEFSQAEPPYLKSLNIFRVTLGADHPLTAAALSNLGVLYAEWAAASEATERHAHLEKEDEYTPAALATTRRVRGEWHPDTALRLNNEALRLARRGIRAEAVEHIRRAAALWLDLLGLNHPWTLKLLQYLLALARGGDASGLRELAAACRAAHRTWGENRLAELCRRHGVPEEGEAGAMLPCLNRKVVAEVNRLRSQGAPVEQQTWVWEEFESALHAIDLDLEPRPDFDDLLRQGLAAIRAKL